MCSTAYQRDASKDGEETAASSPGTWSAEMIRQLADISVKFDVDCPAEATGSKSENPRQVQKIRRTMCMQSTTQGLLHIKSSRTEFWNNAKLQPPVLKRQLERKLDLPRRPCR